MVETGRVESLIASIRRNFPAELQALRQWVCWMYGPAEEKADGSTSKPKKIPINPNKGGCARVNDSSTWGTLDEACAMAAAKYAICERLASQWLASGNAAKRLAGEAARNAGYVGLGFVFNDQKYFGVDIDHCLGDDGQLSDVALDIMSRLGSYTEFSVSGTGLHILCAGTLPPDTGRRTGPVEVYEKGRYFTTTGKPVGDVLGLCDGSTAIETIIADYIDKPKQKPATGILGPFTGMSVSGPHHLPDDDIIRVAMAGKNGARFALLWAGSTSGYQSASEADLALCNYLAFYTGKDSARMDDLFRQSGLFRQAKWDTPHGADTYGEMTIQKAISGTRNTYAPRRKTVVESSPNQASNTTDKAAAPIDERFEPFASAYRKTNEYYADDGRITVFRAVAGKLERVTLAHFAALITSEITKDDGVTETKELSIDGINQAGERFKTCHIPASEFNSMGWAETNWGASAYTTSGQAARDKVRYAIHRASAGEIVRRAVFTHTGWRKLKSDWIYLHAGGAVGADGIDVMLSGRLSGYELPPETGDKLQAAQASMKLLEVLPERIGLPLLCFMHLAVLCDAFERAGYAVDFTLFLSGPTGSGKTIAATLGLAHFGARFDCTHVPCDFNSTAKDIQLSAFETKDMPLLIDNFIPSTTTQEQRKLDSTVQALLQAWAARTGRNRLNQNGSHQVSRPPRGCGLMTGEFLPRLGQSDIAREFEVRVRSGDITKDETLTALQNLAHEGVLARSMRGFIEYLLPGMDDLPDTLRDEFIKNRTDVQRGLQTEHDRQSSIIAHMLCAAEFMLMYWGRVGAITQPQFVVLYESCRSILMELAREQADAIRNEKPERIFFRTLAGLLTGEQVWIERRGCGQCNGVIGNKDRQCIGMIDENYAYLEYQAAFEQVSESLKRTGGLFPITMLDLQRRLAESGALSLGDGRNYQKKMGAGKRKLWVRAQACPELYEAAGVPYDKPDAQGKVIPISNTKEADYA